MTYKQVCTESGRQKHLFPIRCCISTCFG